jgi:hypothetical protein
MKLKIATMCGAAVWFVFGGLAATAVAAQSAQPSAPAGAAPAASQAAVAAPADPFAGLPQARPQDVSSIDGIMKAIYDVISGDAGVKRDWKRFHSLFYPGARMAPTGTNPTTGKITMRHLTPEDYVRTSGAYLEREGFHEQELVRHVDAYGNIAQVFTSYEARHKLTDEKPFMRGINSIQLFNDGTRWWVTSIAWSQENAKHPLPAAFEKKAAR